MRRLLAATISVAAVLAVTALPAPAARPVKGGLYLGAQGGFDSEDSFPRSEGAAVSFFVSRDGRWLREVFVGVASRCSNGRVHVAMVDRRRVAVRSGGRFSFIASSLEVDPFARTSGVRVEGRFRRSRVARISVHARAEGGDGTTCESRQRLTAPQFRFEGIRFTG